VSGAAVSMVEAVPAFMATGTMEGDSTDKEFMAV
jgi:hypothetical protein